MVVVLKNGISSEDKKRVRDLLLSKNFKINEINGEADTVIAAVGRAFADKDELLTLPGVKTVIPISKPYKLASREFKKDDTIVEIQNCRGQKIRIGGQRIISIAGPQMIESRDQIFTIAKKVAESGALILRGGIYKPRFSPYSFQGLGKEGLKYLKEAGNMYGLPVCSEVVSSLMIDEMKDYLDIFMVGAQSMQDFDLLKNLGQAGKTVILKRSYTASLEELLMSAEYLLSSGCQDVILCERGIRTFEHATSNTLDLSSVPVLKSLTHLPVIVDPCHCVKHRSQVPQMALAAIASGSDGIMVQVHSTDGKPSTEGSCSLEPMQFNKLMHDVEALSPVMGKALCRIRFEKSKEEKSNAEVKKENKKILCAYCGKRGAYAQQAVTRYFDSPDVESLPLDSFDQLFKAVVDGRADYGMVPIENSLAGCVYQNYDNFSRFPDVSIVGSITLNIRHSLLAVKGACLCDIKNVYSHPQALAQCKKFLDEQKGWTQIDAASTATAAKMVSELGKKENAAIGSLLNASLYDLNVLQEDIEDDSHNFTRFLVIKANHVLNDFSFEENVKANMASFIFTTKNESGALLAVLEIFNQMNLNLTRLESRPISGQSWKYWFYSDVELPETFDGREKDVNEFVHCLFEKLKEKTEEVRLLGIYSEGKH